MRNHKKDNATLNESVQKKIGEPGGFIDSCKLVPSSAKPWLLI